MKERKLEEVKIKIIREVNENPESKDLSITEKKILIERRMSKARKNKENKKNDHSIHKECKGKILHLLLMNLDSNITQIKKDLKRLSTTMKFEKRSFNKVKDSILFSQQYILFLFILIEIICTQRKIF